MKRLLPRISQLALLPAVLSLAACDLAPTYQPQDLVVPEHWSEPGSAAASHTASASVQPNWWTLYQDPILNQIEEQATANNADLHAAAERFVQARDSMMQAQSRLMPQIGLGVGASTSLISWETDLWAAIRNERSVEVAVAQQRAAEYAAARLSLQAEIARDYFVLRGLDAQSANYQQSIAYYEKSLGIVQARVRGLLSPKLDETRAQELLYRSRAEALEIQSQRQVMEHAIAILANRAPSSFHIAPIDNNLTTAIPTIPVTMPSQLLQRRPDIARAERHMAEANRLMGVKRAAFYPNVSLRAGGDADSGLGIDLPIFDGGYRRADLQKSGSMYREAQDQYRATVLNAFREVEDGLTRVDRLTAELKNQQAVVTAAGQTQSMTMDLYKGGLNTSLDIIVAQVNTLEARLRESRIQMELLQASTELIRALGGGWNRQALPDADSIQPFGPLQYRNLEKPAPAGGIDVNNHPAASSDLTHS